MSRFSIPTSSGVRICLTAGCWLVFISLLHLYLDWEGRARNIVRMGYMPVVTNLAAPVIDYETKNDNLHFEAVKFSSFSDMAEAFHSGAIQAAFIIAPLAIRLFEQGVPLKIVYIGNRNESTLVMRTGLTIESPLDLEGKTIAVPIRYSGQYLALRRYLRQNDLDASRVKIVEVPPPDMPAALASSQIDGYFVGEPFGSEAIVSRIGSRFLDAESIWPKFICNVLIVRTELIRSHPQWVQVLVGMAAASGLWASTHLQKAVGILSTYWGMVPRIIHYSFSHPPGRFRFDLYVPVAGELNEIAREMRRDNLMHKNVNVGEMVDDRFALAARKYFTGSVDNLSSIKWSLEKGLRIQAAQR
ncbi:MAG: ABC transporter substrate-binding protein [Syntrophobacteraceae bacterium]